MYNYRTVQNVLERGLDQIDQEDQLEQALPEHDNIRGNNYYK